MSVVIKGASQLVSQSVPSHPAPPRRRAPSRLFDSPRRSSLHGRGDALFKLLGTAVRELASTYQLCMFVSHCFNSSPSDF